MEHLSEKEKYIMWTSLFVKPPKILAEFPSYLEFSWFHTRALEKKCSELTFLKALNKSNNLYICMYTQSISIWRMKRTMVL